MRFRVLFSILIFLLIISVVYAEDIAIVIEFPNEDIKTDCITVDTSTSGYDILEKSKFDITWSSKGAFGHALCKIDNIGDEVSGTVCEWGSESWAFFIKNGINWGLSPVGYDAGLDCWSRDFSSYGGHYCGVDKDVIGFVRTDFDSVTFLPKKEPTKYSFEQICQSPKSISFDGSTTNFSQYSHEELKNLKGVIIEKTNVGKIDFGNSALDFTSSLDFDNYIVIEKAKISIDTNNLQTLANKPATLTMNNLDFDTTPKILMDDEECPSSICQDISYSNNILKFKVTHFTTYEAVEDKEDKLEIKNVDLGVNQKEFLNIDDRDEIKDIIFSGSELIFYVKVRNIFEDNVDIEDIIITVRLKGVDIEEESNKFTLENEESEEETISLVIPPDTSSGEYNIIIKAKGEDEFGKNHRDSFDLSINIEKRENISPIKSLDKKTENLLITQQNPLKEEITIYAIKENNKIPKYIRNIFITLLIFNIILFGLYFVIKKVKSKQIIIKNDK